MKRRGRRPHPDILTPREWEVLDLIREGLSNEQIAERLEISVDGAKYHVSEILSKLGVRDRLEAARWSAEQRPWWAIALGPLGWWRRPLAAKLVAAALAVAIAAGGGLVVWGLVVTRGTGASLSPTRTPSEFAGQVLLFDASAGRAKPIAGNHNLMLAKWVTQGETFTAYDIYARAWKLYDLKGKEVRTLYALPAETAPYITTHLEPAPDGATAFKMTFSPPIALPSVPLGLTILDLASGKESPFAGPPGLNFDPLFSPDGKKLAYVHRDVSTNSLLVAEPDGRSWTVLRSTPSPTEPVPLQWSPDGSTLLLHTLTSLSADSYEVVSTEGLVIWQSDFDRLTDVVWAGAGRLVIHQSEVTTPNGVTLPGLMKYVRIADGAESEVPGVLNGRVVASIAPSGRYAIVGPSATGRRCSLVDLETGVELANGQQNQTNVALSCTVVEWTADGRLALASFGGN